MVSAMVASCGAEWLIFELARVSKPATHTHWAGWEGRMGTIECDDGMESILGCSGELQQFLLVEHGGARVV